MRALVTGWKDIVNENGTWLQTFGCVVFGDGIRSSFDETITLADNDSSAQIKAKMTSAIRSRSILEWNQVVENNQVIFPDGTRG